MKYKTKITMSENHEGKWVVAAQANDGTVWSGGYYDTFGEAGQAAERALGNIRQMISKREKGVE